MRCLCVRIKRALTLAERAVGKRAHAQRIALYLPLCRRVLSAAHQAGCGEPGSRMSRVKDYISFAIWFVGLSYVAVWPMAVMESVAAWLEPQARMSSACGGLVVAPLQQLCLAHEAVALSPGLHLIGTLAAFWVTVRLMVLLVILPLRRLLPVKAVPDKAQAVLALARITSVLRNSLAPKFLGPLPRLRSRPVPPRRYVPPRREFGLRGRSR
jgi:hypothetical protein